MSGVSKLPADSDLNDRPGTYGRHQRSNTFPGPQPLTNASISYALFKSVLSFMGIQFEPRSIHCSGRCPRSQSAGRRCPQDNRILWATRRDIPGKLVAPTVPKALSDFSSQSSFSQVAQPSSTLGLKRGICHFWLAFLP